MKRTAGLFAIALATAALTGCTGNHERPAKDLAAPRVDPQAVPKDITLYRPAPVLGAQFEATAAGYALTDSWLGAAAPTATIDQQRAVVIRALDAQGNAVATVSVDNPRDVHTTGARDPDRAVLPKATLTVFFARPEAIDSLAVEVRRGPNEGFRQSFKVEPRERPRGYE